MIKVDVGRSQTWSEVFHVDVVRDVVTIWRAEVETCANNRSGSIKGAMKSWCWYGKLHEKRESVVRREESGCDAWYARTSSAVQYLHDSALQVAGRGGLLQSGMRPPRQPNNEQWLRAISDPQDQIIQSRASRISFGGPVMTRASTIDT